jgi:hypothetical protein
VLVSASRNSSGGFVCRRESKKKGDGRELQVATGRASLLREICREDKIEEDDIIDVFVVVVCACVSFASIQRVRTDLINQRHLLLLHQVRNNNNVPV